MRPHALLRTTDQWARCAHQGTALDEGGGVLLAWTDPSASDGEAGAPVGGGLAFHNVCRL